MAKKKYRRVYCAVFNCLNSLLTHPEINFFKLPGDSERMDTQEQGTDHGNVAGIRLIVLNLPEDEGEGLGFRLTRTLWDPYPWVHDVVAESRADTAGLKTGDCLLQADGKDLLGLPIGQVAGLIRGDGAGHGVSLLVWNCGVDPKDDPELLWSCGGGARGERSRRALAGVVRALSCCVCSSTATKALNCARSHLYCEGCWSRLQRCALCRETLPAKDSPYARNLVAEQVFEAIATEYEIKTKRKPTHTASAYSSPNRSPAISPTASRRGQYQLSMMNKNRRVAMNDKFASDPNINRTSNNDFTSTPTNNSNTTKTNQNITTGNSNSNCQNENKPQTQNSNENVQNGSESNNNNCPYNCQNVMQHKLVARLRQACSLADLQNMAVQTCPLSKSLNNVNFNDNCTGNTDHRNSADNVTVTNSANSGELNNHPVFILTAPPIYVLKCEHSQ